jgi:hypothetical protein
MARKLGAAIQQLSSYVGTTVADLRKCGWINTVMHGVAER